MDRLAGFSLKPGTIHPDRLKPDHRQVLPLPGELKLEM
jgi:hypothetical protein